MPWHPHFTVSIVTPWREATVVAEVVATRDAIERGLMYREHLAPDAGVLFLMGTEDVWVFHTRNMCFPIDILFITSDQTVAGIVSNAEPCLETLWSVDEPSLYVLEVNAGWAAAHQIGIGACVRFRAPRNVRSQR